jgi:hypothetical protein
VSAIRDNDGRFPPFEDDAVPKGVSWTLPFLALAASLVGCTTSSDPATPAIVSPAPGITSPPTLSSPAAATDGAAAGSDGTAYSTVNFAIPLSVAVAPSLGAARPYDAARLVSWTSSADANESVRFLAPVEVYEPGASAAGPPPVDYAAYLSSLARSGAVLSDITTSVLDGRPATLVTATSTASLDGSLGCPVQGGDRAADCYGLQPELSLRIAVVDVDGTPLVAWARTDALNPDTMFIEEFERMLSSIDFR